MSRTVGPTRSLASVSDLFRWPPVRWMAGLRPARRSVVVASAVTLVYVALCVAVLGRSPLVQLDTAVLRWSPASRWPALHPLLSVWVLLGQRGICLALAATWLILRAMRTRDPRALITLGLATLLLDASVGLVKTVIGRLGPLQLGVAALHRGASTIFTNGTIFPSGHTANAVVTWGLLAWLARRHRHRWAGVAALMAVSIGLSTVYLGTHWVSDVLAGWAAGGLVLLAVPALAALADRLYRWRARPGRRPAGATAEAAERMPA